MADNEKPRLGFTTVITERSYNEIEIIPDVVKDLIRQLVNELGWDPLVVSDKINIAPARVYEILAEPKKPQ